MKIELYTMNDNHSLIKAGDCVVSKDTLGEKYFYIVGRHGMREGVFDINNNAFYSFENQPLIKLLKRFNEELIEIIPANELVLNRK